MPNSSANARAAQQAAQAAKQAVVISLTCSVCARSYETTMVRACSKVCDDAACKKAAQASAARAWKERNRERWRASKRRGDWSARVCVGCGSSFKPTVKAKARPARKCPGCALDAATERLQRALDRWLRRQEDSADRTTRVRSAARLRVRRRYHLDAAYRAAQLEKRRRQWVSNPEGERLKVWRWSIGKRYGNHISPTLRLLLEERREIWRDLFGSRPVELS
jgi:hypothetical protein